MRYLLEMLVGKQLLFSRIFYAETENVAIEEMNKEIKRIYAESKDVSNHITNLYSITWINGDRNDIF